jgi:Meiotically up-regulated gene 113
MKGVIIAASPSPIILATMDKQEIIDEISRTAKLNNGKALGQERFERETGIKKSNWYPYHWLRWSDAIKEAGLIPNQLSTATSKDFAIEKLIGLIQEIGRFPVAGEFRIKSKQDPTFPSHGVFGNFGGKQKLASAVVNYCHTHGGLEEIIEICTDHIGNNETSSTVDANALTELMDGFVYLMKSGRYYKIGRTDAVGRRHSEIKTQMPEELTVIHHISTDDPSGIEAYWHKRFSAKRKNGEWFDLTRADINAFKRRKKFM